MPNRFRFVHFRRSFNIRNFYSLSAFTRRCTLGHRLRYLKIPAFENLCSPHVVVKYNKNSNGTKKATKEKKYNGNAMSILSRIGF